MSEKSYNILLTVILSIIGLAIITGGGILIYKNHIDKEAEKQSEETVRDFKKELEEISSLSDGDHSGQNVNTNTGINQNNGNNSGDPYEKEKNQSQKNKKVANRRMNGYKVAGILEIPKIKLEYPILEELTQRTLEIGLAILGQTARLNDPGVVAIAGHNYRSKMFFSRIHTLKKGDKIYVTDTQGRRVAYEIYKMEHLPPSNIEYLRRDTNGKREINLSTCNNDSTLRLVVWAKEVE